MKQRCLEFDFLGFASTASLLSELHFTFVANHPSAGTIIESCQALKIPKLSPHLLANLSGTRFQYQSFYNIHMRKWLCRYPSFLRSYIALKKDIAFNQSVARLVALRATVFLDGCQPLLANEVCYQGLEGSDAAMYPQRTRGFYCLFEDLGKAFPSGLRAVAVEPSASRHTVAVWSWGWAD